MGKKRQVHADEFKAKVALEAVKGVRGAGSNGFMSIVLNCATTRTPGVFG